MNSFVASSMKQRMLGFLVIVGSTLSFVDAAAGGVCFDVIDAGQIDTHFAKIKSKFSAVRVYETNMGSANAISAAKKAGLQIAAGVWLRSGEGKIQADIDAIVSGIKGNPGTVIAVYVGNEDLANGMSADAVTGYVNRVKGALAGTGVPVGSVQIDGDFLNAPGLAAACDIVGVNIYPYFGSSPASINNPIDDLTARFNAVNSKYGGKAKLTETGWPTSGTYNGHVGSYDNAKAYWNAYNSWSYGSGGGAPFYFQYRDIAGKSPEYEAHFGLVDGSGAWKFDVAPSPPATAAPTTPPPTTPKPTPPPTTTTTAPPPTTTTVTPAPTTTTVTPAPTTTILTPAPTNATTLSPTNATDSLDLTNGTSTTGNWTLGNATFDHASNGTNTSTPEGLGMVNSIDAANTESADGGASTAVGASPAAAPAGPVAGAGSPGAQSIGQDNTVKANTSAAANGESDSTTPIVAAAGSLVLVAAVALYVVRRKAQANVDDEKDSFDPEFGMDNMPQTAGGSVDFASTQFNGNAPTPIAPTATPAAAPVFNPKDSIAWLEDRESSMHEDVIQHEVSFDEEDEDDDTPAAMDDRTTMDLLDNSLNTVRSATEILL
ncbi:Aste57867_1112 [Aphanomyces stellatus]|uniref:glucan endo-1,3-beta-D-glucosidase n=1 Tax=Aphanomyces stellatus TaxID=120398 RepID=A0A485K9H4_9STRA|nr:hypothetical protein As57867_001111 [Aphanomyces stellatus]VFT78333.1 Aste57867_1112 [Aphanomyces stellatus]